MNIEILNNKKKKKIVERLKEFGIDNIDFLILKSGKNKFRIFSGDIDRETLSYLIKKLRIEGIGLYFASIDNNIRLSLDACHILKDKINKKIIEFNEEETEKWFYGEDIERKVKHEGFVIIKDREGDILGCGKVGKGKIINFLPKERRKNHKVYK